MANSNGWGDGAANNQIGWGKAAYNTIGWGDSQEKSWAGLTDIVGIATDTDAQAFISAASITNPTQQAALDTLVKDLKSYSIWTKMKAIYPFVGGTASTHKWNLKDPRDLDAAFRLVFNGGWNHSSTGATPNGTNGYADTKLVPSSAFTSGNNSSGVYLRTQNINVGAVIGTQSSTAATRNWMFVRYDATDYHEIRNNTSSILSVTSPSTSQGYWMSGRISTSQQKMFRNGSVIATGNQVENSTFSSNPFFIAANNNNGTPNEYSNRQYSFAHIGNGLTDTEASNLYTAVQAFQVALSRNI